MTNSSNDTILSHTTPEQKLPTVDSQTIGEKKFAIAEKPVTVLQNEGINNGKGKCGCSINLDLGTLTMKNNKQMKLKDTFKQYFGKLVATCMNIKMVLFPKLCLKLSRA